MKATVNLHEKLQQYNEVNPEKNQEELILKEAEKILSNAVSDDLDTLLKVGMLSNVSQANEIKSRQLYKSPFEEVYDISAIKKLAIDYKLRLLPSFRYNGSIDPLLPSKIKEFCAKNNIEPNCGRFYIIAPSASFKLEKRPKDPIMFYKIDAQKYAFVHKWGNDFSPFRKILSFPFKSIFHYIASWFAFIYTIVICNSTKSDNEGWLGLCLISLLVTIIFSLIILGAHAARYWYLENEDREDEFEVQFSNDVWDSEYN